MKKDLFNFFKKKKNSKDGNSGDGGRFEEIAQRLSKYFTTEPEKERVLRHEDFDAAGDTYYATVSARYKICQRILLALFVLFALVSILFNIKDITYDNFFYLIKDFGAAAQSEGANYETLSYDASADQSFTLYRGGLAVVSRSNVSVFTATGRRTLNSNAAYSKPYVVASDKYLLVYDMGDGNFAIYNSFAKVYSEKTDYPITNACFAEDGSFALLTRSEEHEAVIIVYDENFERVAKYSRGLYAIDIAIDEDGERLGALYVGTEGGIVSTHVVFYDLKKHEKTEEYVYTESFPLACSFSGGGGFSAVTDSAVIVFDKRLDEEYVSASYAAKTISGAWSDGEYSAVALCDGIVTDINEIIIFDKNGKLVYNEIVPSEVDQLCVSSGYVFIKNSEGVLRIKIKDSSNEQLECQSGKMLLYDASTALVCSQSKAVYLNFND